MDFRKIILSLLIVPFFIQAQTADFNWLVGKWQIQSDKTEMYEEWQRDGNRFKGESYSINNGGKKVSEILYLEKFADQWAYIALPIKQNITLFALYDTHYGVYTFVNYEHDFPQRIIYSPQDSETIDVTVEGEKNGAYKSFTLTMKKVEHTKLK